jgi:hypothetical protein
MEGLLEVIESEEMFNRGELNRKDSFETDKFKDKRVMKFRGIKDAVNFAGGFVFNYLIPKYGEEEAKKFPMAKSEPLQILEIDKLLGLTPEDPNKEVWLVIASERYHEVQEYMNSLSKV